LAGSDEGIVRCPTKVASRFNGWNENHTTLTDASSQRWQLVVEMHTMLFQMQSGALGVKRAFAKKKIDAP
jgi:hypothetical protein